MYRTSVCCDSIIVIIYLTQDHSRNFTGKDLVHVFRKLEVEGLINHSLFTCAICDVSGSFSLNVFYPGFVHKVHSKLGTGIVATFYARVYYTYFNLIN